MTGIPALAILAATTVQVREITVTDTPGECENCHQPDSAVVHVYSTPSDDRGDGYLVVCLASRCVHWAVGNALDTSPVDSPVTVELAHQVAIPFAS
jgi:hypothetical protein